MQAIQPITPAQPPVQLRSRRINPQRVQQRRSQRHRVVAIEASVKFVTNVLLSACVVSAFVQIVPHYRSTGEKLSQIQSEVLLTQERVTLEQADFNHHFDPQQTATIMQEYSNRIAPGQRQVVWLEEYTAGQPKSPHSPEYAGLH